MIIPAFQRWRQIRLSKITEAKAMLSGFIKGVFLTAFLCSTALCFGCLTELSRQIKNLEDKDYRVRCQAAEALGKLGNPKAVPHLITALKRDTFDVKVAAAEALGRLKDPRALEPLLEALVNSAIPDLRQKAAQAIVELGDPRTVDLLLARLPKERIFPEAIEVIDKLQDKRLLPLLLRALDRNSHSPGKAASALASFKGPGAMEAAIAALRDAQTREGAGWALRKMYGHPVADALIITLRDPDKDVRWLAAKILGEKKEVLAVDALVTALQDPDKEVRARAAWALGEIKDPKAVAPMLAALKDNYHHTRVCAADYLGSIREGMAVGPLITLLKDMDISVRRSAAHALVKIKDPRALPALVACLQYDNDQSKIAIARALGMLGDPKVLPHLVPLLTNWSINEEMAKILTQLKWEPRTIEEKIHLAVAQRKTIELMGSWPETKKILLKDMDANDRSKVRNAFFAFNIIGNEEVIPQLIEKLNKKGSIALAQLYLNCGNKKLEEAARMWAKQRNCIILPALGTISGPPHWGKPH